MTRFDKSVPHLSLIHILDAASQAVTLSIGLAGGYAMWLGLMRVADAAGLQKGLGELLKKPIAWLFPEARSAKSREAISKMCIRDRAWTIC